MKLSRRGTLGAALGGVAAFFGPKGETAMPFYPTSPSAEPQIQAEKMKDIGYEISRLKRIASGDLTDEEQDCYPTACRSLSRFEVLKSVSPNARYLFERRYEHERHKSRLIDQAIKQLTQYNKTGILRNFF